MSKQKIKLSKEKETLLIPLYCKAQETQSNNPIIKDEKSLEIIKKIDYDYDKLKVPKKSCVTLAIRAKKLDEYTENFINNHRQTTVLHLGCGLDNRYGRIKKNNVLWYELDFDDVIELRGNFYQETDNYRFIASTITDYNWLESIEVKGQVLIVAEGLFMYLKEDDLKELFSRFHEKFPGAHLVFDAYSKYTAKNIKKHASIRKTGAEIFWGIDDPKTIEDWNNNYKFIEEWYFTDYEHSENLSFFYKLSFKIAGLFKMAKKAHRILYYKI